MTTVNYNRFSDPVYQWSSLDEFLTSSGWIDGIHSIGSDSSRFDLLLRGDVRSLNGIEALPVFFSGAVNRDGTAPPFFSGSTLARQVGVPIVSIADPTLELSESLTIGWYTGRGSSHFQQLLSRFLIELCSEIGCDLVLVGGSAGGFASLFFANEIGCSAFVWNPQTDLLRYGAWAVRDYLAAVLCDASWLGGLTSDRSKTDPIDLQDARARLNGAGIDSLVRRIDSIPRLIYLQNESDHHVERHALPFRLVNDFVSLGDGLYADQQRYMVIGPFAQGHIAPRRETIEQCLRLSIGRRSELGEDLKQLSRD